MTGFRDRNGAVPGPRDRDDRSVPGGADVTARYVPKGPRPVRTAVVVNAAGECDGNTTDLATSGSGSAGKRLPGQ